MAGQVVWPLEDFDSLKAQADKELEQLSTGLKQEEPQPETASAHHIITSCTDIGDVVNVVTDVVDKQKCVMTVMGMSGAGAASRFFLGSNTQDMISEARFPILLIPSQAKYQPLTRIAFATDLDRGDIELIHSVASLARHFNADLLLTHVTDEKYEADEDKEQIEAFLNQVTCKANYPKIYYRHIKSAGVVKGLDWLCEHGAIDMLVMVHREENLVKRLFELSHTQKLSHHIEIPLLVLPEGLPPVRF